MSDPVKHDYEPMEISPQVSEGSDREGEPMDVEYPGEYNEGEESTEPPRSGNTLKDTKNLRKGNKSEAVERSSMVLRKRNKGSKLNNNNLGKENEKPPGNSANKGSAGDKNLHKIRKTAGVKKKRKRPEKDSLSAKGFVFIALPL